MNNSIKLSVFALFFVASYSLNAQNQANESVLGANTGLSLVGALFNLADIEEDVTARSIPALQLTYDYAVTDVISIGAAGSYQRYVLSYENYEGDQSQDFDVTFGRTNVAARVLFHYGGDEVLDLYSGARLGLTSWAINVNADNVSDYVPPVTAGIVFAPQIVLFGIKGYFIPNLGVNAELSLGAPHYISLGLSYRFLGNNYNN